MRIAIPLAALLVGCPTTTEPPPDPTPVPDDDDVTGDDDSGDDDSAECVPTTCEAEGAVCGPLQDGCGGELQCGDCLGAAECGSAVPNQCGCAVLVDGGIATLRLEPVTAWLDVTVNGQPVVSTASAYGTFSLSASDGAQATGSQWSKRPTWDPAAGASLDAVPVRVLPGHYSVRYAIGGTDAGSVWPRNTGGDIGTIDVLADGDRFAVDLTSLEVAPALSFGGVPLADLLPYEQSSPVVDVTLIRGTDSVRLLRMGGGQPAFMPSTVRLSPGAYSVKYRNDAGRDVSAPADGLGGFPLGVDVVAATLTVPAEGGPLAIDVPVADWTLEVTLAGAPVDASNLAESDDAAFAVVPSAGSLPGLMTTMLHLPELWDGGARAAMPVRIVPGSWELLYESRRGQDDPATGSASWPWNSATVASAVAVTDGLVTAVDVVPRQLTVDVTLAGAPAEFEDPAPRLSLQASRSTWRLPPLFEAGAPAVPYTVVVQDGTYGISYERGSDPSPTLPTPGLGGGPPSAAARATVPWPMAWRAQSLNQALVVAGDQSLVVDVTSACALISTTVEGTAAPAWDEIGLRNRVELASPTSGGPVQWGWLRGPTGAVDGGTGSLCVLPGPYQVSYRAGDDADWPDSSSRQGDVTVGANTSIALDLEAVSGGVRFVNRDATVTLEDHPRIWLTRDDPRATAGMISPWMEGPTDGLTAPVVLPRGEFIVHYYPATAQYEVATNPSVPAQPQWPTAAAMHIGCLIVQ
jgi:hypothetical protein